MESKQGLEAPVLAGGVYHIPLFDGYVPSYKALPPLGERPAIQYTPGVERVTIVSPEADLASVCPEPPAAAPSGLYWYEYTRRVTMRFDEASEVVDDPRSVERAM